jgi:hypothetical protein
MLTIFDKGGVMAQGIGRGDRIGVTVVGIGALVVAAITLGATVIQVIGEITSATVRLDVMADSPASALTGSGGIDSARWTGAAIEASGAAPGDRMLLAAGTLLTGLSWVAVALAVAYLCRRLVQGSPFAATVTRVAIFTAFTVIVGPTLGRLLTDLATNTIVIAAHAHDPLVVGFGFDAGTWAAGLALALVALAFRVGERLQRDTEGLV